MAKAKTKAKAAPKAKAAIEGVRLDPDHVLTPGNTVTFVARAAEGRAAVKIETARGAWMGVPSNSVSGARQSKILESGPISVTFYDDGEAYAEGSWVV